MRPLISVVMPVFNGEKYVVTALESIYREGIEGIEIVVVDDGSSDRTLDLVRGFMSRLPLRLMTPGRIGNWVAVTNIGLRESTGMWACFLHQDDLWLPGKTARVRNELERAEGALVLHNASFIAPDGRPLGSWTCPLPGGVVPSEEFMGHLLVQNFIAICSPLFRREAAIRSGGLDESLWYTADWDFWLKLGLLGPVRFVPETLSAFRVHPESQTMAHGLRPGEWEQQLTIVFRRHFPCWTATGKHRRRVERAAMASVAINSALAAASRGEPVRWREPIRRFLALGPWGWHLYLQDSRIVQRVVARLKLRRSLSSRSRRKLVSTLAS